MIAFLGVLPSCYPISVTNQCNFEISFAFTAKANILVGPPSPLTVRFLHMLTCFGNWTIFLKLGEVDLYFEVFPTLSYLITFCISCLVCLIFGRMIASPGLGCSPICVIYYHILYPSVYTASTNTQNMFCVSKLFLKIKSFHSHSKDLNIQLKFQLSLV